MSDCSNTSSIDWPARSGRERAEHVAARLEDAAAQRAADTRCVPFGRVEERGQPARVGIPGVENRRTDHRPERGTGPIVIRGDVEIELDMASA